jgi:pyruvate formate lyase activating enzyme
MKNFAAAARLAAGRNNPPALVASTLLVSGYVGADEVAGIAGFIASLDSETPYSLLAFHPDFCMSDLPVTSRAEAERCMEAALSAGLKNVHLGNAHVLR